MRRQDTEKGPDRFAVVVVEAPAVIVWSLVDGASLLHHAAIVLVVPPLLIIMLSPNLNAVIMRPLDSLGRQ